MKRISFIYGVLLTFLGSLYLLQWRDELIIQPMLLALLIFIYFIIIIILLFKKETIKYFIIGSIVGFSFAFFFSNRALENMKLNSIKTFNDREENQIVRGWITEAPDRRPTLTRYTIETFSIENSDGKHLISENVLIFDYSTFPEYSVGDFIQVKGKLESPKAINAFAYDRYLAVQAIYSIVNRALIEKEESPPRPFSIKYSPLRILVPIREWLEYRIRKIFPEPHASLLAGLLTGSRSGISKDLADQFRRAGISHIVAISGYNITMILLLANNLLFWIPIKRRVLPLSIGVILFTLFVGADAPVVRACIMGILGLIAVTAERKATTRLLILWSGSIMAAWNPLSLWYDVSFQLSFLATIGLSEVSPLLKKIFSWVPETLGVRESLAATIAAEITTLPIAIIIFKQLSLVAPVSNILVAPLVPLAMILGFSATMVGSLWMHAGLLLGYGGWFVLEIILQIAHVSSAISWSVIDIHLL